MLRAWIESPRPVVAIAARLYAACSVCRALVFGADEAEVDSRLAAHRERRCAD